MSSQPPTPYRIHKSQADWHIRAVDHWQKANQNLKLFAEDCYNVENKQALADDCQCSSRTIQLYAAAWGLYQELLETYGETVSLLWERGEISVWRKAPQLQNSLGLTLDKTYDYLKTAIEHGMNRDSFAAHVDNKENSTPQWARRILHAIKILLPTNMDWIVGMPRDKRAKYQRATDAYIQALKEIAEEA